MADLDDGPEQNPLPQDIIQQTILSLVQYQEFDLIFTHGPRGEYTRHRRHEEVSSAVLALWKREALIADELHQFAYTDHEKSTLPEARTDADYQLNLQDSLWQKKYQLVTEVYGFSPQSWEARTTPHREAFWRQIKPHGKQKTNTREEKLP